MISTKYQCWTSTYYNFDTHPVDLLITIIGVDYWYAYTFISNWYRFIDIGILHNSSTKFTKMKVSLISLLLCYHCTCKVWRHLPWWRGEAWGTGAKTLRSIGCPILFRCSWINSWSQRPKFSLVGSIIDWNELVTNLVRTSYCILSTSQYMLWIKIPMIEHCVEGILPLW